MQILEAIQVLPGDALIPMHWVRSLLAMATSEQLSPRHLGPTETKIAPSGPSGEAE